MTPTLTSILANTSEAPPGTGEWIKIALYIAGTLFFILSLVEKLKSVFGRTPPLDQEIKQRHEKAEEQRAALHEKVEDLAKTVREGREDDRKALYNKIASASREVGERVDSAMNEVRGDLQDLALKAAKMEQLTETHTQQLHQHSATMERILEKLPRRQG